ncbi:MAG: NCS2 family permease [Halobacteriaceae archaeon]
MGTATSDGKRTYIKDRLAEYFGFEAHGTDLRTEIIAGLTTFLTMSYIVVVNPSILAGTDVNFAVEGVQPAISITGISQSATFQMVAIVTILSAALATFIMAVYANRPFAQAPGLALNAFFAFTVVGAMGIPWQVALAAVVVEGIIFIILTLIGAREYVIHLFPEPVKFAVGTGIGLFLALIGFEAMGVVTGEGGTILSLGNLAQSPTAVLSIVGLFFTLALYSRGIPGSIVIGIILTTLVGYGVTALGLVEEGVLVRDTLPRATYDITPIAGQFLEGIFGAPAQGVDGFAFALVVFTFFFVDFFDTAGTLTGVSQAAGFLDENGNLPEIEKPLMADAIGTTVGGMLGTSTVTTFIESSTGIEEGGRTGMTALVVSLLFVATIIFVPLAAGIPTYASHLALVVVGIIMLGNVNDVNWDNISHTIPAGLTILIMPFTYNIGYGIAAGIVSYPIVKLAVGEWRDIHLGQWVLAGSFIVYFYVRTAGILG